MDWNYIETCWRDSKLKPVAEDRIAFELKQSKNPFSKAVELLESCWKNFKGKPSKTPLVIINELQKHSTKAEQLLDENIKISALNVALKHKNALLIEKVCRLFRLSDNSPRYLETAKELVKLKKYNEACLCASSLNLQGNFTIEEIAIPLFLQDKVNLVETYVKDHRNLQIEFLKYLDHLILDTRRARCIASALAVPDMRPDRLIPKSLGKLIARLLKLYDIPPETCPNLCKVRGGGAMKYLINRRFNEGTVDNENWSDLLMSAVGNDKELHLELVILLVTYNEPEEALKWALHFEIEKQLWPPIVEELYHRSPVNTPVLEPSDGNADQDDEVWELEEIKYLTFRLDRSDIHIVETLAEFKKCVEEIQCYDVVAIDGEWKPSFGLQQEKLSLLQLAIWDSVFLLDVLALKEILQPCHWELLVDCVLCNPSVIKLGFGFTSDIQQLAKLVPSAQKKLKNLENMLDFAVLYPKLHLHCPELLVKNPSVAANCPQDSRGLSQLTCTMLGVPLDKSMQFSDWEKRPLREQQTVYAALDAYCLLQIYEVWFKKSKELGKDFLSLAKKALASVTENTKQNSKVKEPKQKLKLPFDQHMMLGPVKCKSDRPPMSVPDLHVIVDTMLQGLGKHLRICGVDTLILDNDKYHDEAAKIAQRDGRKILTSGAPYQQLKQYVPVGDCINLPNGLTAQEQAQIVFNHFNVQLTKEDIFSRCTACNGGKYIEIPGKAMQTMWMAHQNIGWASNPAPAQSKVPYPGGVVDTHNAVIESTKVCIALQKLSPMVFDRIQMFFVCTDCGKVYWEGSHHGRVLQRLSPLLQSSEQPSKESAEASRELKCKSPESSGPCDSTNKQSIPCQVAAPAVETKRALPPPPEMYDSDDDELYDDDY